MEKKYIIKLFGILFFMSSMTVSSSLAAVTFFLEDIPNAYPQKNFVKNPGFDALYVESGDGQIPFYWRKAYGSDSQIQTSTVELKEGYRALLLEDTGSDRVGVVSDSIKVTPGFNYTANVDVKSVDFSSAGYLFLRFYDESDTLILSSSTETNSSSWTALTITKMAPEDAVKAEILCLVTAGPDIGQVYFDNASLVYADEMVANGSWAGCPANALPANWIQQNAAFSTSIEEYNSEKVLSIEDASNVEEKGAAIILPATPGVPYKLISDARILTPGDDGAALQLRFLDVSQNLIDGSSIQISSKQWQSYDVSAVAPAGTAFIRLLLSSTGTHTGTTLFKNVSLRENYSRYYVSPDGAGDGLSYATPAVYTSKTLWTAVNSEAENHPVKVIFLTGSYTKSNLRLEKIGTDRNAILLEGEKPFGSVFGGLYGVRFYGAKNIVIRNIHFNSETAQTARFVMGHRDGDTRNITVSDCYLINIINIAYGACSIMGTNTYDITVSDCAFIRVGKKNDGSHIFYNSRGSHGINILDNYFEDGWGTYVKIRSGSSGYRILRNTFIQNNGYRTTSSKPFIHFSAINGTGGKDEVVGTDYRIENNTFKYNLHSQSPIWILISGETPVHHPEYYEVTESEKTLIEGTGAAARRNKVILENFGIDILNDWVISDNSYSNASPVKLLLRRNSPPNGYKGVSANLNDLIED